MDNGLIELLSEAAEVAEDTMPTDLGERLRAAIQSLRKEAEPVGVNGLIKLLKVLGDMCAEYVPNGAPLREQAQQAIQSLQSAEPVGTEEARPEDAARLVLDVMPNGHFFIVGGDREPGDKRADRPYTAVVRCPSLSPIASTHPSPVQAQIPDAKTLAKAVYEDLCDHPEFTPDDFSSVIVTLGDLEDAVEDALSASEPSNTIVQGEWVKCSDRLPTIVDASDTGQVWYAYPGAESGEINVVTVRWTSVTPQENYTNWWAKIQVVKPKPPTEGAHYHHESRSITQCMADDDGSCYGIGCPQLRDGEPKGTGRHCPLDNPPTEG